MNYLNYLFFLFFFPSKKLKIIAEREEIGLCFILSLKSYLECYLSLNYTLNVI